MALLEDGGDAEYTLRSRKHWALLVYLLAHRGRAFPRERLARLFWDTEPRLARHSLSQALYDIRTTLPGVDFESSTSQLGAGADELTYDGEAFEEAVRSDDLSRAVRLYGGRFAPDVEDAGNSDFTRWLESERQRYRRLAEMALYRHVRESHDRAEWGEMCVSAMRLLNMNPLSEDAHRALMRGLWLQGDRAAAVRHFEEVEGFLDRELPGGVGRETLDLVERIRANDRAPEPVPDDDRRRDMVGREEEFGVLKRRLEVLREDGRGGMVRVHGEAGMGKTRLLEEFRSLVALDGVRLVESRCYAAESDVAYGPVVEALEGLAGEAAAADGDGELTYHQLGHLFPEAFDRPSGSRDAFAEPDAGRRRLYEEAADLLRRAADRAPLVWLMEDVHWIDPSSASLLHYLVRRLGDSPLLVVVTARTHEEVDGPARELLEDELGSLSSVVDVELEPLEREETAELVRAAGGDSDLLEETVDRIHVLAGGNPFYALELLQASESLESDEVRDVLDQGSKGLITRSLRTLLERRLRGLPADSVRIMEAVAVAGRHATSPLVREVTEFPPSRIVDLAGGLYERGLLRDVDGRLEFLHDITRDFVYARLGDLQRSSLHLSVGEGLEDRENVADPATLARHFKRGGERPRAFEYALEAAREAERRHAHDEAIRMGKMALELAEGEQEEAGALECLIMGQFSASQFAQACDSVDKLRRQASPTCYNQKAVTLVAAHAYIEQYMWDDAHRELDSTTDAQRGVNGYASNDVETWAHSQHLRLKAAFMSNNAQLARRVIKTIRAFMKKSCTVEHPPGVEGLLASTLAAYEVFFESAWKANWRLSELGPIDDYPQSLQLKTTLLHGIAQSRISEWEKAERTFLECVNLARKYNDVWYCVQSYNNLMCINMDQGKWAKAEQYYEQTEKMGSSLAEGFRTLIYPRLNAADMEFSRGHYKRAAARYLDVLEHWEEALEYSNVGVSVKAGLGLCKLALGNLRDAEEIYHGIDVTTWQDMLTLPERNVTTWFVGYMMWKDKPDQARLFMEDVGKRDRRVHLVSGLRTLWLVQLFSANSNNGMTEPEQFTKGKEELKKIGSGWFTWFSKRWLAAAEGRNPTVGDKVGV
jgi:DNA-binding SARP family transcriptional activator